MNPSAEELALSSLRWLRENWARSGLSGKDFSRIVRVSAQQLRGWKRRVERDGPAIGSLSPRTGWASDQMTPRGTCDRLRRVRHPGVIEDKTGRVRP